MLAMAIFYGYWVLRTNHYVFTMVTARKTSVHKSFPVWKLWSFPAVPKLGNELSFQAWKLPLSTIACTCGYLGNLVHFQTWELLGNSIVSKLGNSCALRSFLLWVRLSWNVDLFLDPLYITCTYQVEVKKKLK